MRGDQLIGSISQMVCGIALTTMLALFSANAQAAERLYVEAHKSKEIYVIDANTFKEVAKIDVGFPIDDVVGSHDGKMVFGNASIPNGNPIGQPDAGMVYGISTATNQILWWCSIPGMPQHLTVSQDDKRLYVVALDKNYLYVVDTASGRIVDTWYGVMGNHGTELSPDGKHLYVGNFFTRAIYAYDTATGQVDRTYQARESIRPFKMDQGEKHIYYQLSNFHGFEVQDLETGKITNVVDLPKLAPNQHADANGTVDHGLAITPDGKTLLAAGSMADYVAFYSLPDLKFLGTVPVGKAPNWIRVRADSKIAFTGNPGSNDVSVIDIPQMKEITRVPAGLRPARFDIVDVR
jgi:DNA-binding beta-propeller fold protein YncE